MKILLATAHPYIPQLLGGAQSSMHEMATEMSKLGHHVSVLSGLTGDGWRGMKSRLELKLGRRNYVVDRSLGYPVYRAWFPWEVAAEVAKRVGADVVVPQSGFPVRIAKALDGVDTDTVIYLRNVDLDDLGGSLHDLSGVTYIANSKFTAERYHELFSIQATVIYPLIRRENYETASTRENVTFINPHPHKGLNVALAVAERCPEIPFVFVEAWLLSAQERSDLMHRLAKLPNITLRPPTRNMKSIYGKAKIVLAPSKWEEAFGRVAVEAQFSGVPVVASACGGLPEAVGPGGILVDREAPPEVWAAAVRRLWADEVLYDKVSHAARRYCDRPEMDRAQQIISLLAAFSSPQQAAPIGQETSRQSQAAE